MTTRRSRLWALAGLFCLPAVVQSAQVDVIDARPPHTETGLATRPLAGSAPKMPTGLEPAAVAERIVAAIEAGETDLPSSAFG